MKPNMILGLLLASSVSATATNTDIQGVSFQVDTLSHFKIGPGLTQSHLVFKGPARTFHAFLTDMYVPEADGLRVKVDVGRDSCNTAEAITSIAKRKTNDNTQYLAGINGDFFITSSFANQHEFKNAILGYPNMSCATEGKLVAPDIIDKVSRENALIIGSEGMWIDATDMKYRVLNNAGDTIVDATAMNYPRRDEEMVVYNSFMGKYTKTSPQGREIVLRPAEGANWRFNKSVKFIVDGDWHAGQSYIPEDGLVISCGPKYKNEFIDGLKKGDIVKLKLVVSLPAFGKLKPDVQEICGGDVRILKENVTTTEAIRWINTPSAKYSRSLVGYSKDRDHVVTCAIDASAVSSGVTYYEAADVMRYLGCWDALDLDGGGSTAIWTNSHGIMNNLRDGSERAVGNGIFFVLDRPASKEVKSIRFADWRQTLPQYGLYEPVIYGYNEYGQLVDTDIKGFTLDAPVELGTIEGGTALLASGSGTHTLTARLGDLTADIAVTVDNSFPATPRESAYLIDGHRTWNVVLEAPVGDKTMEVAPTAYTWTVADPSIASINAKGELKGLSNGTTVISGSLGDNKFDIPVTVEIPKSSSLSVFGTIDPTEWKINRTGVADDAKITATEDGMLVDYRVTSTRGTKITLARETAFYSLPDGFEMTITPGATALTDITLNLKTANGRNILALKPEKVPAAGTSETLTFDLKNYIDLDDPAVYPIKFVSLALSGPAKTGSYSVAINGINTTYSKVGSGVEDITLDGLTTEKLIYTLDGNVMTLPFTADKVEIVNTLGSTIVSATDTDTLLIPAGFAIVKATLGKKVLTAKVFVK